MKEEKKPSMAENYKTLGQKMMESGRKAYRAMTGPSDEEAEREQALARRKRNRSR